MVTRKGTMVTSLVSPCLLTLRTREIPVRKRPIVEMVASHETTHLSVSDSILATKLSMLCSTSELSKENVLRNKMMWGEMMIRD